MDVEPWTAVCQDCDFERQMPSRDHAEHAKRVHEDRTGHTAFLEPE